MDNEILEFVPSLRFYLLTRYSQQADALVQQFNDYVAEHAALRARVEQAEADENRLRDVVRRLLAEAKVEELVDVTDPENNGFVQVWSELEAVAFALERK